MVRAVFIMTLAAAFLSCAGEQKNNDQDTPTKSDRWAEIEALNHQLTSAALTNNFTKVQPLYTEHPLLLAEYMPIIDSKDGIAQYYDQLLKRQTLETFEKEISELFDFGKTVLEIGVYKKSFKNAKNQSGQYWNIWQLQEDGSLLLSAESYGLFNPLEDPSILTVNSIQGAVWDTQKVRGQVKIPLEFDAYAALMENIVRDRDTKKLLQLYTEDGAYTPFADTTKMGAENLSKHYHAYHKNPVTIDSIETSTYDYLPVSDGVIRFTQFYVEWTVPGFSGKNQGTGVSYWKRQEDNTLKIHRQIGHHIHFNP